ncbi:MAG: hypothetical protein F4138_05745 [Acidimicrobiia bacterium]|nr:hypothetical protein [Acidimicrobiia bacterium]MYC57274.1 hypothetical protein [Acidimicrobiia bacterium]MYG94478.1 hypothetical protein [Acidimicrobiia bacterium]MYI30936.1 hypothetical protein [Acidimicrobiia bacterium]
MDDNNAFERSKELSEGSLEEQQAGYLDDLASLFDEEEEEGLGQEGSDLGVWSESSSEVESESGETAVDAAPRWREDIPVTEGASEQMGGLSDIPEFSSVASGASVFADPEPTEAFDLSAAGRVDEVLSLNEPLTGPVTELTAMRDPVSVSSASVGSGEHGSSLRVRSSTAVLVGLILGGLVLGAVALGEKITLALLAIVLLICATEWFTTMRKAGFQPPMLLGYVTITVLPITAYWRGAEGMSLTLLFGLFGAGMWYVSGVARERPLMNLGVTLLGITYVGFTGAFGGLLLSAPEGAQLVLTAVVLTAVNDVGAFVVGKTAGRTRLSSVSPNKTLEGFVGGAILTINVALVFISVLEMGPFGDSSSRSDGVILGIVVAAVAPLADLLESALKRDLGVKDMGTLLPGHGGMLDRIDALLFVLPATYFTGLMLGVI